MNPIIKILKDLNINEEKIKELFETLTKNPMMAMGIIQKLGIPPEQLQKIMALVMSSPAIIKEAVDELGLDFSAVEKAKDVLKDKMNSKD